MIPKLSMKIVLRLSGMALALALFLALPHLALAQAGPYDDASDPVYAVWEDGDNGGAGFGPWTLSTTGNAGHFAGTSTVNGDGDGNGDGDIDVSDVAWGMWANSGGQSNAVRTFDMPLSAGSVFYVHLDTGYVDTGNTVGLGLRNGSSENLLEIYFQGGGANYTINRLAGEMDTGLGFSDEGLAIVITLTSASTYQARIDLLAGGGGTFTGDLMSPTNGQTVAEARFFNVNAGSNDPRNFYLNRMGYCPSHIVVTSSGASGAGTLRQAVADACDGGVITFAPALSGATIGLGGSQLSLDRRLTISGTVPITISGGNASRVFYIASTGVVTLSHLTITGGSEGPGGGIHNDGGALLVDHCTITGNVVDEQFGGGLYNADEGVATVQYSTITGNTSSGGVVAAGGGGMANNNATLMVWHSTVSGNTAPTGGGIFNQTLFTTATVDLIHTSVVSNAGGGVSNTVAFLGVATVRLTHSLVAAQLSGTDCSNNGGGSYASLGYNLDSDGTCGLMATGDIAGADPRLGPLADNGGETWTHALLSDSPAIDAVPLSACAGNLTDQRDMPRADLACDTGAFEMQLSDNTRVIKAVAAGVPATYTFGPTLAKIVISDTGGCLTGIGVERVAGNHPQANNANLQTGAYWTITPVGCPTGFSASLTLPYALAAAGDKLCRWAGSGWDCAADEASMVPGVSVTRHAIAAFSEWIVGDNVGPTAVGLRALAGRGGWWAGGVLLVIGVVAALRRKRR